MFIDSPDFNHRKVLNPHNAPSQVDRPQQYQLGLERSLLAKHVADRLNSHQQDEQILERFRRQAAELKHQKWLSKKAKSPPIPDPHHISIKSKSEHFLKVIQEPQYPHILPTTSTIIQQQRVEKRREKIQKGDRDIVRLQRLLHSKQKEIRRKDKKLQRSRQVIVLMQEKIRQLQRERQLGEKQEELQTQKISALIEQMNYRIAANRAIFQEQLAKLKAQKNVSKPVLPLSLPKKVADNVSTPIKYAQKKEVRPSDSDRFLAGPSVFYQLPKISETTARLNLSLLSKSGKNKLQTMNPQGYY